jgi:hypothetical protein
MSTLEDLAQAIDSAAQEAAPSVAMLQSLIVNAISGITRLSVQEIYSTRDQSFFEDLATGLRELLVAHLEERFLAKIISQIAAATSVSVTAQMPVTKL